MSASEKMDDSMRCSKCGERRRTAALRYADNQRYCHQCWKFEIKHRRQQRERRFRQRLLLIFVAVAIVTIVGIVVL